MADDEIKDESMELIEEKAKVSTEETPSQEAPSSSSSSLTPEATSAKNVTYEDGVAIYTDENTKYRYKWCKETSQWKPLDNEHYKWCEETQKWIPKAVENEYYRWCTKTNQWIPKMKQEEGKAAGVYGYDEKERCQIYTDHDGAVFFWDAEKKAWFPRIDDDFLALYQLNYGFVDNTSTPASTQSTEKGDGGATTVAMHPTETKMKTDSAMDDDDDESKQQQAGKKRKAPAVPPKWFDIPPEQNTKVYVSNLPLDITESEFSEVMNKCGMVMKDVKTGKLKLKLYRDSNGEPKGDGLCHYIKVESVELALNVLDGYDVRGKKIKVQRAEFQMRGEYNPALRPRMSKNDKEKMRKMQEKLFDWRPEKMRGERAKHEKTVIIKNLFEPQLFDREVHLIIDYQNDLREECTKCGTVRKVIVYDRHPDGVAQVMMADPEEADLVVKLMNGRFFGQRKLTAETWDGKTKYKIDESETDKNDRLKKWETFLEASVEEESKKEKRLDAMETAEEAIAVTEAATSSSPAEGESEPAEPPDNQIEKDNAEESIDS